MSDTTPQPAPGQPTAEQLPAEPTIPPLKGPVIVEVHDHAAPTRAEPAAAETPPAEPAPQAAAPSSPEPAPAPAAQTPPAADAPQAAEPHPTPSSPRLIAFMNQKGGVGKTTSVVSVAAALAKAGSRVLTIDLDPQAHLSLSLGIDPESLDASVYHLLTDRDCSVLEVIHEVEGYATHNARLAVIPAEVALAGVESELAELLATGMAQSILRNKLTPVIGEFDYILIDCPPSLGLLTINALVLAKEVIVPMQAHFLALQGLSKLFETVQMVGAGINPSLRIAGIVLCMHEANTILAGEVINDLNGFLESARDQPVPWSNATVFQPPVRRNIKLAESPSFGQPIFDYAPDSHGASDYKKLAQSIAAHTAAIA